MGYSCDLERYASSYLKLGLKLPLSCDTSKLDKFRPFTIPADQASFPNLIFKYFRPSRFLISVLSFWWWDQDLIFLGFAFQFMSTVGMQKMLLFALKQLRRKYHNLIYALCFWQLLHSLLFKVGFWKFKCRKQFVLFFTI